MEFIKKENGNRASPPSPFPCGEGVEAPKFLREDAMLILGI